MATAIQRRRGTTAQHANFTGLAGEITIDTTLNTIIVHDGTTAGGIRLAKYSEVQAASEGDITAVNTPVGSGLTGGTASGAANLSINYEQLSGNLIPSANNTYSLGNVSHVWKDVFVGPGSLYVNGQKVLEDNNGTIVVSADSGQNLSLNTSGGGDLELNAGATGDIQFKSNVILSAGKTITASGGLKLSSNLDVNSQYINNVTNPVQAQDAATKGYVDGASYLSAGDGLSKSTGAFSVDSTVVRTTGAQTIGGAKTFSNDLVVSGNLTVSGTTTTVNSETISLADNIIDLNSNFTTGAPTENAGIKIKRGDAADVQIRWNEADDKWQFTNDGSTYQNMLTDSAARALLSAGGDLSYNSSTGVISFTQDKAWSSLTGTPTTIDGYGITNAYTKTEVDSAISTAVAGKDNTDEITEGSTNLYFTNARARAAISVSGDLAYDSATGVISFTNDAGDIESVTAGSGLTGGGTSGAVTLNIGAGTGITVNADDVAVNAAYVKGLFSASGDISYNSTTGVFSFTNDAGDIESVTAGSGLTGGGVSGAVTLNIGAGTGITVNADDVAVNATYIKGLFSATDSGGDGSFSYSNGVFTYTGPSATEVRAHFSAGTGITLTSGAIAVDSTIATKTYADNAATTAVAAVIDAAPATLDTLNELAAALGDDANFSTTVTNSIATKLATADFDSTANTWIGTQSTTALAEGTNLYFTAARARGNISVTDAGGDGSMSYNSSTGVITYTGPSQAEANARIDARLSGGTGITYTGGVIATTITQYTDALARAAISVSGDLAYDSATGVISFTNDAGDIESVTAGSGLTGGGTSGAVTLNIGAGSGITVNADDVAVNATYIKNLFSATDVGGDGSFSYSNGVFTYTGPSAAEVRAHFTAGTGITINSGTVSTNDSAIVHDNLSGFVANEHVDHSSVQVIAGSGLTGGGNIVASRTFNVGAGTGITVNADDVAVNATYIKNLFSATDAGGDGSFSYDGNGVFTYTGPSQAEANTRIDARLSGGTGITYTSGVIAVDTNVISTQSYVDDSISALVNGADAAYDTLKEIQDAMATDTELANAIASITVGNGTQTITAGSYATGGGSFTANQTSNSSVTIGVDATSANTASKVVARDASGNFSAGTITASLTGNVTGTVSTLSNHDTADLAEGTNLYFTAARARGNISVTDAGGDGSLSYNSGTGVITYTGPSSTEVRAHFSAGTGLTYSSGAFSITNTAVTAGTYGSATAVPQVVVNAQGQVTSASNVSIAIDASQVTAGTLASARLPDLTVADFAGAAIQTGAEAFADSDTVLMTAAAIQDKILSYGYSTTTGTVTSVATSGSVNGITLSGGTITSSGTITLGGSLSGVRLDQLEAANVITSGETFVDTDAQLMTAAAIEDRILSKGYTTNVGDITGVTAGTGLSGGGASGDVTLSLATSGVTAGTYGTATVVPSFTVDAYGRITGVSNVTISGDITAVTAGSYLTGGGSSGAVTLNVDATTTATASKVVARDASGDVYANLFQGTATSARYADLAERYEADAILEPGTVVCFGGEKEITACDHENDHAVAGVVSTDPAYMMNSAAGNNDTHPYIALTGRVPVKVVGPVAKGDLLVASGVKGHAMANNDAKAGTIIGKAISSSDAGEGVVEALITLM